MATPVGEQLKQARAARGLSLEQVNEAIHLRREYLEALENDQRDALPSLVQGRGYLRLYAGFLDLPVKPLLDIWEGKTPLESTDAPPAANEGAEPGESHLPNAEPEPKASPTVLSTPPDAGESLPPPPTGSVGSQEIFIEIGKVLQQQREALGLSRAEVERYTRLRQHYLQALEEGRMDRMPSPVQGRGMLSNYAAFLNLDEDKLLLRFAEGLQQQRLERIPPPETQTTTSKKRAARQVSPLRQVITPDVLFGVIVVSAILFFAIRTAASISALRTQESQPTARAIADVLLTPQISPSALDETLALGELPLAQPTSAPGETTGNLPDATQPAADATQPAENATLAATLAEVSTLEVLQTPTPQLTVGPINGDPLQVYIIAHQRAWMRVNADNKEAFNGRVVPGNAYAYSGTKRIELLTGNAAALQIFYNQQDLGSLGLAGEVVDLVFAPEGIQTPTATVTFTPTATPLASPTPTITPTPQASQSITPFVP